MRCEFLDGSGGRKGRCKRKATHEVDATYTHLCCLKHAREFKAANRIRTVIRKIGAKP